MVSNVIWENTFDKSGYGIWGRKSVKTLIDSNKYNVSISAVGHFLNPNDELYKLQFKKMEDPIFVSNLIPTKTNVPRGDRFGYCTCTEIKNPPQDHLDNMNEAKFVLALGSHSEKIYKNYLNNPEKVFRVNFPMYEDNLDPHGKAIQFDNQIDKKFKFLFVGRIDVRKNIETLITAFKEEFGKNKNVILILKIYSPNYNIPLWIKSNKPSDNIFWMSDNLGDMSLLYRAVDAYVTSDLGEAWSAPTQEAMLCGVPAIAPRHSGHLDYMNDSNSWLVDVGDWEPIGQRKDNLYESLLPSEGLVKYPNIGSLKSQMRLVYETFKGKQRNEVLKHERIQKALETKSIVSKETIFNQLDTALTKIKNELL